MQNIASACVKCARCIQSCTTYQIHRDEVHSPRGFLELIRSVELSNRGVVDALDTCFLCTHCVNACPLDLPIDFAIMQVRAKNKKGYFKRFYFFLLRHRKIMDLVFGFLSFIPPCKFKSNKIGVIFKVPFFRQSFLAKYKNTQSQKKSTKKVAIFIGCLANYHYPSTGEALLKILEKLEIEVLLPKQECCGAPALFGGDMQTTLLLIQKNIIYFEKIIDSIEAILVPEATCASVMLKNWQQVLQFFGAMQYQRRLEKILPKIMLSSVYLARYTTLIQKLNKKEKNLKTFTYHDPCHACQTLKITQEPRDILGINFKLKELESPQQCCGFGGIGIQLKNSKIAREVGKRKVKDILSTQANIVSSECSACRVQIDTILKEEHLHVKFSHPLELIAEALED